MLVQSGKMHLRRRVRITAISAVLLLGGIYKLKDLLISEEANAISLERKGLGAGSSETDEPSTVKDLTPAELGLTQCIIATNGLDVSSQTSNDDSQQRLSIPQLLKLCHTGKDLMITRDYALSGPKLKDIYLSTCYPIEMSASQGGRSMGHCSDFVQYIFHSGMRLNPEFDDDTWMQKIKNCPHSTYFHAAYPIDLFFTYNPTKIHNIWLPNIEQMERWQSWLLPQTHAILCKVRILCTALEEYIKENKINPAPPLRFMSHSTPDALLSFQEILSNNTTRPPVKQDFNKFVHVYGKSFWKHTAEVINCFKWHPEWPLLTVIGSKDAAAWGFSEDKPAPNNIQVFSTLEIETLRELQFQGGIHLCPSNNEGYGHYINEARALGAVVITTNHAPMNEFVEDGVSGILVGHNPPYRETYRLIEPHFLPSVNVKPFHICEGVKRVLEMTEAQRSEMGRKARAAYEEETRLMETNLEALETETLEWLNQGQRGIKQWRADMQALVTAITDECDIKGDIIIY
ncbi:hypothetical protein BDR26DRAFT_919494 [Obelidium mucronatum]|nr:hypothetical protein BDR26DRAFT_919494 [Obelidium mucronatum]